MYELWAASVLAVLFLGIFIGYQWAAVQKAKEKYIEHDLQRDTWRLTLSEINEQINRINAAGMQ